MSFMEKQIEFMSYWVVETNHGSEIVTADLVGVPNDWPSVGKAVTPDDNHPSWISVKDNLMDYLEGNEVTEITCKVGWLGRLSASGFMDRTDWTEYDSEKEANEELDEMYGDG